MTYHRRLKTTVFKKYSGYDWTCDGMFQAPKVKGINKRRRSKHERIIRKVMDKKEISYYN
ncbi:hypothetical protein ABE62_15900 [Bacillus amyloliquefaciens]|nr:hypothetical protein CLI97_04065 [Bacillus velezensis]MBG9464100.1 hypothetical protein [Bacillus amyloliquefaciens]